MMTFGLKGIQLSAWCLLLWQYGGGKTYAALRQVTLQPSPRTERDSRLTKLPAENRFDALLAELRDVVKAFLVPGEFRARFGQP